jgi:carotenoid cleavage dioxygenase-like enzyme
VNYHPFDGDGMLHSVRFSGGKASYRNRFVRTRGFEEEQKAGRALWAGIHEPLLTGKPGTFASEKPGWGALEGALGLLRLKDTASTDVVVHAGRIIPTWYLCGEAYAVNLQTLQTEGVHEWSPLEGVSAHPKVDEETGELLFFNYNKKGMHYGVVDKTNTLVHYVDIPIEGTINTPHDMAFSKVHIIHTPAPAEPNTPAPPQHTRAR